MRRSARQFKEKVSLPDGVHLASCCMSSSSELGRPKWGVYPVEFKIADGDGTSKARTVRRALKHSRPPISHAEATFLRGGLYVKIRMYPKGGAFQEVDISGKREAEVRGLAATMSRDIERFEADPTQFDDYDSSLHRLSKSPWLIGIGATVIGTVLATAVLRPFGVL